MSQFDRNIAASLGPIEGELPSSQDTSLSAQGIGNWQSATLGTNTTRIITATGKGRQRRVKILAPNNDAKLAWKTVSKDAAAAPTITVGLAGGLNDGTIIPQGAVEAFTIPDNVDLYIKASVACVLQVTMWEVT